MGIIQLNVPQWREPYKPYKTYSEDLIQDDAEWLELLAKRCDVALDKQPDSRGLKLLRGRMRNWLKQYQIYQQQGGDNAELQIGRAHV